MKLMTTIFVAGLVTGWASCAYADPEDAAEVLFEAAVASVNLDEQGNVTGLTFENGASLDAPQVDPGELEGLSVGGMRPLPFQILELDNPNNPAVPKLVVMSDSVAMDPVELPSDAGAVVRVYPGDVQPSYESGYQFLCQPPRCPMGGQCVRCYSDIRSIRIPALIQTFDPETNQSKVDVLMSEIPVGKP